MILLLITILAIPMADLRETLRALESPISADRATAERQLMQSGDLAREEPALREAIERGGPETKLRIARALGTRPDSFPLLVRWLDASGPAALAAREAVRDLYKSFRGGKSEATPKRGDLEEAPEDSFRRAWARIPSEGIALTKLVDLLHRRDVLDRPLLLDPDLPWDAWVVPGLRSGKPWEDFMGPLFSQILANEPAAFPGKPSIRAYGSFLWLSGDTAPSSEEAIFLRICRGLHAPQATSRRLAALDLGRFGFGPAERLFAESLRDDSSPWLEWSRGLFAGQGVSPWLRERSTIERAIARLPQLAGMHEEMLETLAQLGRRDGADAELEPLYAQALEREKDSASRHMLARLLGTLGSKRAIPALREMTRSANPQALSLLLSLLEQPAAENTALEILESGNPAADALLAAASVIRSERGCKRFGDLLAKSLTDLRKDGQETAALATAPTMRAALARLPQEAALQRSWQAAATNALPWRQDLDLAATCLLYGIDLPSAEGLRAALLAALRAGKIRWPELAARAVGRAQDLATHQALADLALCGDCAESTRLAALAGLEEAISGIYASDRKEELTMLQSTMSPLRLASEKIVSRFEEWIQRSIKPSFDGENFLRD